MSKVKYFQLYESLWDVIKDLSDSEFKHALYPLLEYAFTDKPHTPDSDRFFESIFIQNKVFVDKLQVDIANGKKGGAPAGNKNAKGHGAPKGNKNASKNKQPDKEKDTDTETEKDTDTDTDTENSSPGFTNSPLEGGSNPEKVEEFKVPGARVDDVDWDEIERQGGEGHV